MKGTRDVFDDSDGKLISYMIDVSLIFHYDTIVL